jgi:flagellar biosynthetic protein FliO
MSKKSKKTLLIILIIIVVSTGFIIAKFGSVSAGNVDPNEIGNSENPAQKDNSAGSQIMAPDTSMIIPLIKLIGVLMLVVACIYGFIYVLKKMMGQKFSSNKKDNLIEVLETSYIAQKKSISLVRFVDRSVLVGVYDTGITVLAELNQDETTKIMADYAVSKPVSGFKNILKDARKSITSLNARRIKTIRISKDSESPQTA